LVRGVWGPADGGWALGHAGGRPTGHIHPSLRESWLAGWLALTD
jgi:hypothetical protein